MDHLVVYHEISGTQVVIDLLEFLGSCDIEAADTDDDSDDELVLDDDEEIDTETEDDDF